MGKKEVLQTIFLSAQQYKANLENKNVLFVYQDKQKIETFESAFHPRNFQHLTGVSLTNNVGSSRFYEQCIAKRLSPNDFELSKEGYTELKLKVLLRMMNIQTTAKMIGDFNNLDSFVVPDKIIGTVYACMGFVRDCDNGYYVPNTIRLDDIREITYKPQKRIICTLTKRIDDDNYTSFSAFSKKYSPETVLAELIKTHSNIDIKLPE